MGRKILIIFTMAFAIFLFGCKKPKKPTDGIKMDSLVSDYIDSQDMYYKVKYPSFDSRVKVKNEYFESRFFPALRQFFELLCNHQELDVKFDGENSDKINEYISSFYNDKCVNINASIANSFLNIYINENGKVLLNKDNVLYESKDKAVNYDKFCTFDVVYFSSCYDAQNGTIFIQKNDYFYRTTNTIRYDHWYGKGLDKMTYEQAIDSGISTSEYLELYSYKLFEEAYRLFFDEHEYYYILKLPSIDSYDIITAIDLKNKYDVGTFGENIYSASYHKNNENVDERVYLMTAIQGISIVGMKQTKNGYHLLGLDYLNIEEYVNLLAMNDEKINKEISDFKIEHNIN